MHPTNNDFRACYLLTAELLPCIQHRETFQKAHVDQPTTLPVPHRSVGLVHHDPSRLKVGHSRRVFRHWQSFYHRTKRYCDYHLSERCGYLPLGATVHLLLQEL